MKDYTKLLDGLLIEVPEMSQFVTFGRHSGFPDCCVWFFMSKWLLSYMQQTPFIDEYRKRLVEEGVLPGYIPCPTCLEKREFVQVKQCKCGDEV